jgi:hypothetical protein
MDKTLTPIRLGIKGKLGRTLSRSTRAVDDRHAPHHQRNVKHCSSGEMGLR